jgi:hypothetical protein
MSSAVRPVARVVHLVLADVFSYAACDQLAGRGRREGNTNLQGCGEVAAGDSGHSVVLHRLDWV